MQMEEKKKAGAVVHVSNKIDMKTKAIVRDKKALHNGKRNNPTRGYNPSKHSYTQHRSTKIRKTNLFGHKGRD